jgi:glycosyltransferase involved in cell wall biosynthesis
VHAECSNRAVPARLIEGPRPKSIGYCLHVLRIVFFGTYDAGRHPRIGVLREGFVDHGDDVSECNVVLGLDTATRVRMARRPWLAAALVLRLALTWPRLWRRARTVAKPDAVIVGYLGHFDVHLARRLWRDSCVVLDHLVPAGEAGRDRGLTSKRTLGLLDRLDAAALRAVDVVCVDTDEHRELIPAHARQRVIVAPVGATQSWFRPPVRRDAKKVRAIFFGLYTPLQGAPVIGDAIRLLRDEPIEFTMVGSGQDHAATRAAAGESPHAEWRTWVDGNDLPTFVAAHDICLGIFGTSPKAHRVVPTKVFQGAAAGAAIVTSDTSPQRRALAEAALFVPPGDSAALAEGLAGLAGDADALWRLRESAHRRATEAFQPGEVVAPLRERLADMA